MTPHERKTELTVTPSPNLRLAADTSKAYSLSEDTGISTGVAYPLALPNCCMEEAGAKERVAGIIFVRALPELMRARAAEDTS